MEISHHILDIEKNTRNMTADLESRMKNLINGYEYLENLSSQVRFVALPNFLSILSKDSPRHYWNERL